MSVAAFMLAVASKEIAIVYPVLLLCWLVAGWGESLRRALKAAVPHMLAAASIALAMIMHPGYRALLRNVVAFSLSWGNLGARVEGLAGLARVLLFPWSTNIDHGRLSVGIGDWVLVAALGVVVYAALLTLRYGPSTAAAGVLWATASFIPTDILLVREVPTADRLLYLPMVGVAVCVAAAGDLSMRVAWRRVGLVGAVAVLVCLGTLTIARNTQYQSEVALWEDAVRKAPSNVRAWVNLGYAYELASDLDRAAREYQAALALRPGLWWAEKGLEVVRQKKGTLGGR